MKNLKFLCALTVIPLITAIPLNAQPVDPDMAENNSDLEPDDSDHMLNDIDNMPQPAGERMDEAEPEQNMPVIDDPSTNPSPIPPSQPGTEVPKVMDNARPEQPVSAPETSLPAPVEAKEYPVCSATITDSCINPRAAKGNPR